MNNQQGIQTPGVVPDLVRERTYTNDGVMNVVTKRKRLRGIRSSYFTNRGSHHV